MNEIDLQNYNKQKLYPYTRGICAILLIIPFADLKAQEYKSDYWAHCSKESLFRPSTTTNKQYNFSNFLNQDTIYLYADKIIADKEQNFKLEGNIQVEKSSAKLTGNTAKYQRSKSRLEAEGDIRFEIDNLLLTGEGAEFDMVERSGSVRQSRIWLLDRHLRGAAEKIDLDKQEKVKLIDAWLTSCDEGKEDWRIKASELTLDRAANKGTAKHARIEFYHVPIFYFPYFSYPLSGRKTGFLFPHIGSSSSLGTTISVPYYLNLWPHRDATLTVDYFRKRGTQLRTEFRYLNKRNGGQINYEVLPSDKVTKEDLQHVAYQHKGNPLKGVATAIDFSYISNDDYLKDFGGDLGVASTSFLNQRADISYSHKYFNLAALLQNFQTVDKSIALQNYPYRRVPQIAFNTHDFAISSYLKFRFEGEYTNFDHENKIIRDETTGDVIKKIVVGNRTDLYPQFYIPIEGPAGFIQPKIGLRFTQWNLENKDNEALDTETQRTLPIYSLDGGLFFERLAKKSGFIQTLEPRLFYLNVPYVDQSTLIDIDDTNNSIKTFDSALMNFNLSSLFSENRFSGRDLIGDANQLSVSLTSRLLDNRGKERLRATIGQLVYFDDRRVNLNIGEVDDKTISDTVFEFNSRWNPYISTRFDLRYDYEFDQIGQGGVRINFQKDKNRQVNLNYRYEKNDNKTEIDQIEAQFIWPIHRNWKPVLYWRYSIEDKRNLENYQGIEYDSCCWAFRIVRRDYIQDLANRDISVLFELELKGLSSVGNKANELFGQGQD